MKSKLLVKFKDINKIFFFYSLEIKDEFFNNLEMKNELLRI